MNWFEEQIRKRKEADEAAVEETVRKMTGAVLGRRSPLATDSERARDAISDVLKYYHARSNRVEEAMQASDDYYEALEYILQPTGIVQRGVTLSGKWYRDASAAMLGRKKDDGRLIALIPNGWGGYYYRDPLTAKRVHVGHKIADNIEKKAIVFYRSFPQTKLTLGNLIGFGLQQIAVGDIVFLIAAALLVTSVGLLIPWLNNILFSDVISAGSVSALAGIGFFLVCVTISRMLFNSVESLLSTRITTKISIATEAAAMLRILSLPTSFFRKFSAGELNSRASYISTMGKQIMSMLLNTGLTAVFSLAYIGQIFVYAPSLVVPSLLVTLATLVISIVHVVVQMGVSQKGMLASSKESGISYQLITGIRKIRLAGAEQRAYARWGRAFANAAQYTYSPPVFLKISNVLTLAITLIGSIIMYFLAVRTGVSVSEYYAFNSAYGMVNSAFLAISGIAASFARLKPMLDMVKPILETVPETAEKKRIVTELSGKIELNNVSFRYEENDRLILDNLSLTILPGQYVAVVGKTGCGKSTLLRIMLGFEPPWKGTVYYDDLDIRKTDLRSLRRRIGTVLQSGKLFSADIFSNITISAPWLTLKEAWEAADIAGIGDDIREMPMGMNTLISEGQGGVSGGQRQRILIARAIAPKPSILMFDEATSALDNLTQKHVSEALDRMKCTRIVIAHRLSTIRQCDRILMLEDGKIVEDGTYEELMKKNGRFAEMVERQQLNRG